MRGLRRAQTAGSAVSQAETAKSCVELGERMPVPLEMQARLCDSGNVASLWACSGMHAI